MNKSYFLPETGCLYYILNGELHFESVPLISGGLVNFEEPMAVEWNIIEGAKLGDGRDMTEELKEIKRILEQTA